ncbi:MAG: capsular polysaccharide biosynthesis protein [Bacteroidia bacterium]|nr:MAG: capsular polysaccharide biosynthesis protein [Bacteroidia bacterium]
MASTGKAFAPVVVSIVLLAGLSPQSRGPESDSTGVTIMALGDVNLGRSVGQRLLKGDVAYPFLQIRPVLERHDIVFANLESQIANRGGETQHPRDRYRFCAPPQAAQALRLGGISVVSTSNNHAFDYGAEALAETIDELSAAGVQWTGTSKDSVDLFPPAIVERNGIRIGFVAYTEFVNRGKGWTGTISIFEQSRARREIAHLRKKAEFVIASYHGGTEYADAPSRGTLAQLRALVDAGADIVVGHHPHVPQGIEWYGRGLIFYSLGNCVFLQPHNTWARKAFAVSMEVRRLGGSVRLAGIKLLPLAVSNQPTFDVTDGVADSLYERLRRLSTAEITRKDKYIVVNRGDR